ncbi:hypothetical protein ACWCQS_39190 [Streptomyces sp. NPDC002076]
MPFGTGALAVRDIAALHAAHDGTSSYLQDMQAAGGVPDSGHLGPELAATAGAGPTPQPSRARRREVS